MVGGVQRLIHESFYQIRRKSKMRSCAVLKDWEGGETHTDL